MGFLKKNDGLTLVELMVSITIGSLIMLAASTVLLLGFRINHQTTESVTRQYTARTVITLLENLASEGEIKQVQSTLDGSWKVRGGDNDKIFLSFCSGEKQIYTGTFETDETNTQKGTPILENVVASYVTLNENVLTISIEDSEHTYTSSVYYRVTPGKDYEDHFKNPALGLENVGGSLESANPRRVFLETLYSQVGGYGGIINHKAEPKNKTAGSDLQCACKNYNFFSEWYVGGFGEKAEASGWNANTPWCACFVSWGLSHIEGLSNPNTKLNPNTATEGDKYIWFANVDTFMKYFKKDTTGGWKTNNPAVGDLVFFDMINESNDPTHMGVVLELLYEADDSTLKGIKTIEGNSADMVAVREYSINDARIIGYGDPWAAQTGTNNQDS